jgi:gluconate 2-dehydrogenase gamma chain
MIDLQHRRTFLRAAMAAGAAWAAADLSQVEEALAWADEQSHARHDSTGVTSGASDAAASAFKALTKAQAEVVEAVAARILPAVDGRPGAHEAGAIHFIDRALATFNAAQKTLYVEGVADLDRRAAARWPTSSTANNPSANFAALTPTQQDELLREIEQTPFFQAARFDTLVGTFALPSWGGNRDFAGWRLIGVEHRPFFQAPFGYYDANTNANASAKD